MLFDLDGVLIDSEGEYSLFWGSMGDRYGLGSDFKDRIKGETLTMILQMFPEGTERLSRMRSTNLKPIWTMRFIPV